MKTWFLWLLFLALAVDMRAQQMELPPPHVRARILKVNLFSPVLDAFTFAYETTRSDDASVQLTVSILPSIGFILTPEYRFYLSEAPAPKGFYVAPFARYGMLDGENAVAGGLVVGYQSYFKQRVTLDAFLGPQLAAGGDESGFLVRGGVTLGLNLVRKKE